MDQLTAQLLASKFGAGAGEDSPAVDLSSLISSQFSDDPLMTALINSMLHQEGADDDEESDSDNERLLAQARKAVRALKQELAIADEMVRYVAEVFGACPLCLGQNRACPECRGRGRPGSFEPLESELLYWVEPALKRLGMHAVKIEQQ